MWVQSLGREDPPGEGHGNALLYSCLDNPMDRGAWATVQRSQRAGHDWSDLAYKHDILLSICVHMNTSMSISIGYIFRSK